MLLKYLFVTFIHTYIMYVSSVLLTWGALITLLGVGFYLIGQGPLNFVGGRGKELSKY